MKNIILGIAIGLALSIGSVSFASTQIKLVMVPEYVGGYKTVDLLQYVANEKSAEDTAKETKPVQPTQPQTAPHHIFLPQYSHTSTA
jgi:hypothetical protein